MSETNKTYKINLEKIAWGTINKKTFLVKIPTSTEKGNIFVLYGIGLDIWKMLVKNYNFKKILKALIKKYPFSKKRIENDLEKFISQLEKSKIIDEIR